jgi:hypothetical protein
MSVEIRADRAPYPVMVKTLSLIEEAGFPMHEKVHEAAMLLRSALNQLNYASEEVRRACGGPGI